MMTGAMCMIPVFIHMVVIFVVTMRFRFVFRVMFFMVMLFVVVGTVLMVYSRSSHMVVFFIVLDCFRWCILCHSSAGGGEGKGSGDQE